MSKEKINELSLNELRRTPLMEQFKAGLDKKNPEDRLLFDKLNRLKEEATLRISKNFTLIQVSMYIEDIVQKKYGNGIESLNKLKYINEESCGTILESIKNIDDIVTNITYEMVAEVRKDGDIPKIMEYIEQRDKENTEVEDKETRNIKLINSKPEDISEEERKIAYEIMKDRHYKRDERDRKYKYEVLYKEAIEEKSRRITLNKQQISKNDER